MKTKICAVCQKEETTLYRVQLTKGKIWIFICTDCCNKVKGEPNYRYGGTWKGDRHQNSFQLRPGCWPDDS